jgi:pyruvate,water dikinase
VTASREWLEPVCTVAGGAEFVEELDTLFAQFMDVTCGSERLLNRPDLVLHALVELAADPDRVSEPEEGHEGLDPAELERRFLETVGPTRREEAAEVLRIARVSWRLRDDDNLLLSRLESQLFRAVDLALERLRDAGRVRGEPQRTEEIIPAVVAALSDPAGRTLELPAVEKAASQARGPSKESPRQLVGQPAAAGLATGNVRRVVEADDIKGFRAGEVLVCDAIQPMMTHLVPLAAGIVERRGGMLIHGAIIAREMQIPCVNGVAHAVDLLEDGQIVTVDGHLGIVTVGRPEFDLELR